MGTELHGICAYRGGGGGGGHPRYPDLLPLWTVQVCAYIYMLTHQLFVLSIVDGQQQEGAISVVERSSRAELRSGILLLVFSGGFQKYWNGAAASIADVWLHANAELFMLWCNTPCRNLIILPISMPRHSSPLKCLYICGLVRKQERGNLNEVGELLDTFEPTLWTKNIHLFIE